MAERSSRRRKRKRIDYVEATEQDDEEEEEEVTTEFQRSLAQYEAEDLEDLTSIASYATAIEFDSQTGCPVRNRNCQHNEESPIDGLVKLSKGLLLQKDPDLFRDLTKIHHIIKQKVHINDMVPWAGTNGDSTRLRAFGFLGKSSLNRLGKDSAVRLHAPEKEGREALLDERANRRAICILHKARERVRGGLGDSTTKANESDSDDVPKTVNPTLVADKLCAAILDNQSGSTSSLDASVLCSKELVAYQTNLHNGAKHLAAHLDAPLHEGFGKVIVTVAIRGSATILLIGKGEDEEENEEDGQDGDGQLQPAWKFHLKEGEAYVLSGNVRNICLHAVLADDGGSGSGDRESLNLRFGIHSVEEAENCIKLHWPDLW